MKNRKVVSDLKYIYLEDKQEGGKKILVRGFDVEWPKMIFGLKFPSHLKFFTPVFVFLARMEIHKGIVSSHHFLFDLLPK